MKRITLRAWDSSKNKMVYDFSDHQSHKMPSLFYEDDRLFAGYFDIVGEWVNIDLMQFAGFHDRTGKAVFEGDIIEYSIAECFDYNIDIDYEKIYNNPQHALMEWSTKAAGFRLKAMCRFTITPQQMTVVGNIYENPELLP